LREALSAQSGTRRIETVRGVGYRLSSRVSSHHRQVRARRLVPV
jgi:DNA-binding winged helix-turn-helix (wHTH) protein